MKERVKRNKYDLDVIVIKFVNVRGDVGVSP